MVLSPEMQNQFAAAAASRPSSLCTRIRSMRPIVRGTRRLLNRSIAEGHVAHPQFFDMLTQQQDQIDLAVTGKQDAKTTMDNIAKYQEDLLKTPA